MSDHYSESDIIEFCKLYNLDIFFNSFPYGYFTPVGEDGLNLSGGQKKILVLARALFQSPKILLLDEIFSNLDDNLKFFVKDLINKINPNIIIISISHGTRDFSGFNNIIRLSLDEN